MSVSPFICLEAEPKFTKVKFILPTPFPHHGEQSLTTKGIFRPHHPEMVSEGLMLTKLPKLTFLYPLFASSPSHCSERSSILSYCPLISQKVHCSWLKMLGQFEFTAMANSVGASMYYLYEIHMLIKLSFDFNFLNNLLSAVLWFELRALPLLYHMSHISSLTSLFLICLFK
jgi:hypothetical protein